MANNTRNMTDDGGSARIPQALPEPSDDTPDVALGYEAADTRWLAAPMSEDPAGSLQRHPR